MQYLQLLSLLIATVAAKGFTVPEGTPDGVYKVEYDAEGSETHTLIGEPVHNAVARSEGSVSRLFARQADGVNCGGYDLNRQNTDDAVEALKRQCNPGAIGGNLNFYSIAGGTVAYVCNYRGIAVTCSRNEIGDSANRITGVCGSYRAGWRNIRNDGRDIQIGYERTGSEFCGRGTDH
jgi:hypothetical protein